MTRELQGILDSGEVTDIKIDGTAVGDSAAKVGPVDAHIADTDNPHSVDKTDVGLDQVDNTADADKPVSDDTQTALDTKIGAEDNNSIGFAPQLTPPTRVEGLLFYDDPSKTLALYNDVAEMTLNIGQEEIIRVHNATGLSISNATPVYQIGVVGGVPSVAPAQADTPVKATVLGVTTHTLINNTDGFITRAGRLIGDFSTFQVADRLYLSDTVAGGMTTTASSLVTSLGLVLDNQVAGAMLVSIISLDPAAMPAMLWRGPWAAGTYLKNDVVTDTGYLMIANKETSDTAAPIPVGNPFYLYQGTAMGPVTESSVKQVAFGTRYTATNAFYLNGYRIKVIAGNEYEIISVIDPLGAAQTDFVNSFTATETGWREFGLVPQVHPAGTVFDLIVIVTQPDPTPTEFSNDWDYETPNQASAPTQGVIKQSNTILDSLRVHSRDNALVDNSAALRGLVPGDRISVGFQEWAIQAITENGADPNNWFDFTVSPAVQHGTDGVQTFTFKTTTLVDLSYDTEVDYYQGSSVARGMFIADGDWHDAIPNDDAYGADVLVQDVYVSPDWDILAITNAGGAAGGVAPLAYSFNKIIAHVVTDDVYEDVNEIIIPSQDPGIYEYAIAWQWDIDSINTSAFFRFSTDNGSNWDEIVSEAKDVNDKYYRYYAFPVDEALAGTRQLKVQARKEVAGDVYNINFCDVIIKRVG